MILNTNNIYITMLRYLWILYVHIVGFLTIYSTVHIDSNIIIEPPKITLNEMDSYIEIKRSKFLKSFSDLTNETKLNSNIEPPFYSKMELQESIQDSNNTIEPAWKRRILFESTPRGNIIMFYDAYKQGFAYYSDTNCVPYSLLNVVAMKYVLVYHCRDFFVDDKVTPETSPSPLIKIHNSNTEKKTVAFDAEKPKNNNQIDLKNAPFAKFKNYSNINYKTIEPTQSKSVTEKKEYNTNKFISLGKLSNYKFLPLNSKKNESPINGFSSKLLDNLFEETQLQKQVMSYKDYKNQKTTSIGSL